MSLRTRFRNWLLKPSTAELANTNGAGSVAAELVWGHVAREMKRNITRTHSLDVTADGLEFVEGMPPGMLAYMQPTAAPIDHGDVQPGELD